MEDVKTDHKLHASLSGFYQYLKVMYRFPEEQVRGIIACNGMILRRINNLTMSLSDIDRIRAYMRGLGLTGETINLYVRSFVFYVTYLEQANRMKAEDQSRLT